MGLCVTLVALGCALAVATSAAAQDDPAPTPTSPLVITESDADPAIEPDSPVGRIIPQPNSGAPPERPGDRGGSLQLGLFALLLAFLAVAAWRIGVTGRRGRHAYAARAHTSGDPVSRGSGHATDAEAGVGPSGGPEPGPRGD